MDKTNRLLMRMLLDGHLRNDVMNRRVIKFITVKIINPVPLEAYKKYLNQFLAKFINH